MGNRKKTPMEIFSYATIAVSLATISGLAMGRVTEQSMHPRLSASPPADPVERYALGQNAYKRPHVRNPRVQPQSATYADAGHEIGRYEQGVRILTPYEPARKIERVRLERLQGWNEQSFANSLEDTPGEYARLDQDHYPPIDIGAVADAPESEDRHPVRHITVRDDRMKPERVSMDTRPAREQGATATLPLFAGR